jgi:hypothetical protein
MAMKSDTIEDHVKSKKHQEKQKKAAEAVKTQPRLNELEELKKAREEAVRQSERNLRGKEHRRRVLMMLLRHGIPPGRLYGDLKELLEEAREFRISVGYPEDLSPACSYCRSRG